MSRCLICREVYNEAILVIHGHHICPKCSRDPELYECVLVRFAEANLKERRYRIADLIKMAKIVVTGVENHLLTEELMRYEKIA